MKNQKGLFALYRELTGKTKHTPAVHADPNYQESTVKTINRYGLDPL